MDATGCRGDQPGQFNYPAGLATDGEAVFVADRGNCRVQKLRLSDGGHVASTVLEEELLDVRRERPAPGVCTSYRSCPYP